MEAEGLGVLGGEHPDTLRRTEALSETHRDRERIQKAERSDAFAEEIEESSRCILSIDMYQYLYR